MATYDGNDPVDRGEKTQGMDPTATFRLDQQAAQREAESRDQQSWELNVRNGEAGALVRESHAALMQSQAAALETVANAIAGAIALGATVATLHGLKRLVRR